MEKEDVRPCVYIEFSFFKFLLLKGNSFSNPLLRKNQTAYNLLLDFLFDSGIDMVLQIEEEEEQQDEHELLRVLEDYHVQGKIRIKKYAKETFANELRTIGEKSPFSICCISSENSQNLQEAVRQKGYTFVSDDNFDDFLQKPFVHRNSFDVAKDGDISQWQDFKKLSHEFNSLVIFDSYLFTNQSKKSRSEYTETVSEIVSNLLYHNSCNLINVLIVFPKLQPNQEVKESIETIRLRIEEALKQKCGKNKQIQLGIAKATHKTPINHDRLIFTNLMVLYSGDSFNYFQQGHTPTIETVLTSYSILNWRSNFQTYFNKLKKLKKITPQIDKLGTQTIRSGICDLEFMRQI